MFVGRQVLAGWALAMLVYWEIRSKMVDGLMVTYVYRVEVYWRAWNGLAVAYIAKSSLIEAGPL